MDNIRECNCPLCGKNFTPENGTTPKEHLAKGILRVYSDMQSFPHVHEQPCLRCGHMRMRPELADNAKSRHFNVYICSECGTDEALRDYRKDVLPLFAWSAVNEILMCLSGIECEKHIPQKGSAYPLCDNPKCEDSKKCNISAHLEDEGGYSRYDK